MVKKSGNKYRTHPTGQYRRSKYQFQGLVDGDPPIFLDPEAFGVRVEVLAEAARRFGGRHPDFGLMVARVSTPGGPRVKLWRENSPRAPVELPRAPENRREADIWRRLDRLPAGGSMVMRPRGADHARAIRRALTRWGRDHPGAGLHVWTRPDGGVRAWVDF